jgi:hypothetical protein
MICLINLGAREQIFCTISGKQTFYYNPVRVVNIAADG